MNWEPKSRVRIVYHLKLVPTVDIRGAQEPAQLVKEKKKKLTSYVF